MHVHAAVRWKVEHGRPQDLAEGGDDDQVGRPGLQLPEGLRLAQPVGLDDGDSRAGGHLLDGRRDHLAAAASGPVRLGDDTNDGVLPKQGSQRGDGEVRGPHKDDAGHPGR